MTALRKIIFWTHLALAVAAGAIILTMAVSGVLLTYEKQIEYWADTRGMDGRAPQPDAERLPTAALISSAQANIEGAPTAVRWRSPIDAPAEIVFGREGTVFVNRYTGEVLGKGPSGAHEFFTKVTRFHRYLSWSDGAKNTFTAPANMAFLFIVVSGFYLWWPRKLSKRAFANITRFRRGLSPKARDFNWHNVIGFWSLVPLFVIALSGTMLSYPWVNDLMYRTVGDTPPPRPGTAPAARPESPTVREPETEPVSVENVSWDKLFTNVQREIPDWMTATLNMKPGEDGLTSVVERGTGGQLQKRVTVTADPETLEITKVATFADHSPGRRARLTLRYLHTGEWFGKIGQTIAGIVSLATLFMIWTGISLALRRLWAWRRRRGRGKDVEELELESVS